MDSPASTPAYRLAYFVPTVKFDELRFDVFLGLCKEARIETTELTGEFFDKYLYERSNAPKFDLILHTLSDIVCETVDPAWLRLLEYLRMQDPDTTIIIDPPDKIFPLLDRYEQYLILSDAAAHDGVFHVPPSVRVLDEDVPSITQALAKLNITFPIMCKPLKCDAPLSSHYHKIIFDEEHLSECKLPCLLQQFIEHDALLYKINVGR